jgi:hypothetical protein
MSIIPEAFDTRLQHHVALGTANVVDAQQQLHDTSMNVFVTEKLQVQRAGYDVFTINHAQCIHLKIYHHCPLTD